MSEIDERVVSLKFDNAEFETKTRQSRKSIEELENSLNASTKSVKGINKLTKATTDLSNVDISKLNKSLDTINYRFSTLGQVGTTVITSFTNTVIGAVSKVTNSVNSVIGTIVEGGKTRALNIEQAKFQLKGLGIAWEDISDDINYAVKDTAYGLDSAAKAAAQLSASQVQLGDDMKAALRAISGVAAMTNSSYDDIANVFTTVAGNGRLMSQQLLQLSARGLNTAATLAKSMGTTESAVREMVTKGEISFTQFAKAMDDAFGEHAKDADSTFTGAMSNVKAALSRLGASFATPSFEALRKVFVALIPVIDGIHKVVSPVIEDFEKLAEFVSDKLVAYLNTFDFGIWDQLSDTTTASKAIETVDSVTESVERLQDVVRAVIRGEYKNQPDRKGLLEAAGYDYDEIQSAVNEVMYSGKSIEEALADIGDATVTTSKQISSSSKNTEETIDNISASLSEMKKSKKELKTQIEDAKAKYGEDSKEVKNLRAELKELTLDIKNTQETLKAKEAARDTIALQAAIQKFHTIVSNFGDSVVNMAKTVRTVVQSIAKGIQQAFGFNIINDLLAFSEAIKSITSSLVPTEDEAEDLTTIFRGLFSIIDFLLQGIKAFADALSPVGRILNNIGDGIRFVLATVFGWTASIDSAAKKTEFFTKVLSPLKTVLTMIADKVDIFADAIRDGFSGNISNIISESADQLGKFGTKVRKLGVPIGILFSKIKSAADLFDYFKIRVATISSKIGVFDSLKKAFNFSSSASFLDVISAFFEKLGTIKASDVVPTIVNFFRKIKEAIENFLNTSDILNTFKETFSDFLSIFDNIGGFNQISDTLNKASQALASFKDSLSGIFGSKNSTTILDEPTAVAASVNEAVGPVKVLASSVLTIGDATDSATSSLQIFKNAFVNTINQIGEALDDDWKQSSLNAILGIIRGGILIAIAMRIKDIVKIASNIAVSFSNIVFSISTALNNISSGIANTLTSTSNLLTAMAKEHKSKALINYAIAISIFAASLIALGVAFKYLPIETMLEAIGTMALLIGGVILLAKAMDKLNPSATVAKVEAVFAGLAIILLLLSFSMVNLALSIGVLTVGLVALYGVIKLFSNMDSETFAAGFEKIKKIIGSLVLFLAGVGFSKFGGKAAAIGLGALVISLIALYFILKQYANLDDDVFASGFKKISIIMTALTTFLASTVLASIGALGFKMIGIAATLLVIMVGLNTMVTTIKRFAELSIFDVVKGISIMSTLLKIIASFLIILSAAMCIFKPKMSQLLGLAALMLMIQVMLSAIIKSLSKLAGMDIKGLVKAIIAMAAIFGVIGRFLVKASKYVKPKVVSQLASLATFLIALTGAVMVLGNLRTNVLLKGVSTIAGTFIALGYALKLMGQGHTTQDVLVMAGMVSTLLILAVSMIKLVEYPWQRIAATGGMIALTMLSMAAAIKIIASTVRNKDGAASMPKAKTLFIALLGTTLVIAAVASALAKLANYPWSSLLAAGVSMSLTLLSLSGIIVALSESKLKKDQLLTSIGVLVAASVSMIIVAASLSLLANYPWSSLLAAGIAAFLALAGIIGLIAAIGSVSQKMGTLNIMASVAVVVEAAASLMLVASAISKLTEYNWQQLLVSALAISGVLLVMAGVLAILSGIGSTGIRSVAIIAAATALLVMANAMMIVAKAVGVLGKGLTSLSKGLKALASVSSAQTKRIVNNFQTMAAGIVATIPLMATSLANGIAQFIVALASNAAEITTSIVALGSAIITGLTTLIPQAVNGGLMLIAAFLQGIADNIGGIVVSVALIIVNFLTALAQMLPLIIDAGLTFIVSFINGVANGIREHGPEIIKAVGNLLESILELILDALGTIGSKIPILGNTISAGVETAKESLRDFFDVDIDSSKAEAQVKQAGTNITSSIDDTSSESKSLLSGLSDKLSDLGIDTAGASSGMANFSDTILGENGLSGLTGDTETGLNELSDLFSDFDIEAPKNIGVTMNGVSVSVEEPLEDTAKKSGELGADALEGFVSSFNNGKETVKAAATADSDSALEGLGTGTSAAQALGNDFASGYTKSISSDENKIAAAGAAKALASSAAEALAKEQQSHSPSKVTALLGTYFVDGYVRGINRNKQKGAKAAQNAAKMVVKAFGDELKAGTKGADFKNITKTMMDSIVTVTSALSSVKQNAGGVLEAYVARYGTSTDKIADKLESLKNKRAELNKKLSKLRKKDSDSAKKNAQKISNTIDGLALKIKSLKSFKGSSTGGAAFAIGQFATQLYKSSDQYVSDKATLKADSKSLKAAKKERNKAQKEYNKAKKSGNKSDIKSAKKKLKEAKKAVKSAQKQLEADAKTISDNIWDMVDNISEAIKTSIKEFTKFTEIEFSTGIDFLNAFSDAANNAMSDMGNIFTDWSGDDDQESYEEELADASHELAEAQKELAYWQEMSNKVNGHSQYYLDKIRESEEALTIATENYQKVLENDPTEKLIKNMESQASGVEEYMNNLNKLSAMGYNSGMIEYLKEQGLDAAQTVTSLANVSADAVEESVNRANKAWAEYSKNMVAYGELTGNEVSVSASSSADAMITTMQSEVNKYKAWKENIDKLAARGLNSAALAELRELGVEGADQVQAFLDMTASQLAQANALYSEKASLSASALVSAYTAKLNDAAAWSNNMTALSDRLRALGLDGSILVDLLQEGPDSAEYVNAMLQMDDSQLAAIANTQTAVGSVAQSASDNIIASWANAGWAGGEAFKQALIDSGLVDASSQAVTDASSAADSTASSEDSSESSTTKTAGKKLAKAFVKGMNKYLKNVANKDNQAGKDLWANAKAVGANIAKGTKSGIKKYTPQTTAQVEAMGAQVISALKRKLGIASPSKVFASLGKFADIGLANGLNKYAGLATDATESIGDSTVDAMRASLTELGYLYSNLDVADQPTIRPVLDLSDVKSDANRLSSMLDQYNYTARLAAQVGAIQASNASLQNGVTNNTTNNDNSQVINNTFNISGSDPQSIADEVEIRIQKQIDRRQSVWA